MFCFSLNKKEQLTDLQFLFIPSYIFMVSYLHSFFGPVRVLCARRSQARRDSNVNTASMGSRYLYLVVRNIPAQVQIPNYKLHRAPPSSLRLRSPPVFAVKPTRVTNSKYRGSCVPSIMGCSVLLTPGNKSQTSVWK